MKSGRDRATTEVAALGANQQHNAIVAEVWLGATREHAQALGVAVCMVAVQSSDELTLCCAEQFRERPAIHEEIVRPAFLRSRAARTPAGAVDEGKLEAGNEHVAVAEFYRAISAMFST